MMLLSGCWNIVCNYAEMLRFAWISSESITCYVGGNVVLGFGIRAILIVFLTMPAVLLLRELWKILSWIVCNILIFFYNSYLYFFDYATGRAMKARRIRNGIRRRQHRRHVRLMGRERKKDRLIRLTGEIG